MPPTNPKREPWQGRFKTISRAGFGFLGSGTTTPMKINKIKEVVPWFKSTYQLRMSDKRQTEIPVSRAQTKRLRELFKL